MIEVQTGEYLEEDDIKGLKIFIKDNLKCLFLK